MAAWEEGIPCLLALLQEIDKEDGKEDNQEDNKEEGEEADSGLGEDEEELEVDVVEDDEVVVEDDEQVGEVSQEHNGSSSKELTEVQQVKEEEDDGGKDEELDHLTLMYEVGAKQKAKDCHYEMLDKEATKETNKALKDKTAERLKSEAEFRQDREDIINFLKEQEEARFFMKEMFFEVNCIVVVQHFDLLSPDGCNCPGQSKGRPLYLICKCFISISRHPYCLPSQDSILIPPDYP